MQPIHFSEPQRQKHRAQRGNGNEEFSKASDRKQRHLLSDRGSHEYIFLNLQKSSNASNSTYKREDGLTQCFLPLSYSKLKISRVTSQGFPGGAVVKNLPANAEDTGSSPGLGRSHMPRSN